MVTHDNSKSLVQQLNQATQNLASATEKLRQAKYSGSDEMVLSELADEVIRHSHVAMDLNAQLEPYLADSEDEWYPAAGQRKRQ